MVAAYFLVSMDGKSSRRRLMRTMNGKKANGSSSTCSSKVPKRWSACGIKRFLLSSIHSTNSGRVHFISAPKRRPMMSSNALRASRSIALRSTTGRALYLSYPKDSIALRRSVVTTSFLTYAEKCAMMLFS